MASNKRERFREQKDFLQKNRNTIVYLIVLLALLGGCCPIRSLSRWQAAAWT